MSTWNTSPPRPSGTPRRPLRGPEDALGPKLAELAHLDDTERALVLGVIDAVTTKAKLRAITGTAS